MDERKEPMIALRREHCLEWLEDYNECLHREKEVNCTAAVLGLPFSLATASYWCLYVPRSGRGGRSLSGSGVHSSRVAANPQEGVTEHGRWRGRWRSLSAWRTRRLCQLHGAGAFHLAYTGR